MLQTLTASESLLTLPADWILEPVVGKRPIRKNWTKTDLDRLSCLAELESGRATGLGLKLGNGLLAIDIDGDSAWELLKKLAGSNGITAFSETTAWTSGRAGRKQCLFSVAEADWPRIKKIRISTGVSGDDGEGEYLEFRWLGQQSVLPPSIHPGTGKPYEWINNPLQHPPTLAPEWLIELSENWHSEYAGYGKLDLVRFPVRLFKHFGGLMRVWLLARRFDISRWKHQDSSKGCGIGKFSLKAAAIILNLKAPTIRGLLRDAKKTGLIRNYKQQGDWVKVFYSSLETAIALTDLEKLGPIAAVKIDDLANIHIIATEVEAQHLQRASLHRQRQEEMQQIKAQGRNPGQPTQIIAPTTLLHPSEQPAQVLARSDRFIYVKPGFRPYGGSQKAIAQLRGISPSTASRHLSNRYRLAASPVRGFREELPPIVKKQVMEKRPNLKNIPEKLCQEEGLVSMFGEWWEPHCNVYLIDHRLVSARRRRSHIEATTDKRDLCLKTTATHISVDKFSLSILPIEEKIEENKSSLPEIKSGLPEFKKWGKTYREGSPLNWNTGELNLKRLQPKSRLKNRDKEKQN
ncbi:bifunctional DNA primase/polymerase [Microcoleus sp. C2C3]|uniref:bifunctional DNA primase/polymerase n=1 Tax=unclassified Microcoleus TaxID=2642155 RepID=UPI002FCF57D8